MGDINLRILMSAIGGASVVGAVGSIASSLGSGGLGGALIATGLAAATLAATLAVTATKAAGNFQSELSSLSTGAGESVKNLGMVNDGLLKMAVDTGTTTKQLTSGLYMIESGGYHGAAGLAILQAAAQGAKVGNADLGVVADATDTVLKNFGDTGLTASNAVNTLVATVSRGKTHMGDLSTSLSQILPTASAARVGLNDVMGAMSTMTGEGIPAANAATYLRQMLIALQAPSAGSVKALSAIGLTTGDVADAMHKSLPGALQMITDKLKSVYGEGTPEYLAAVKHIRW
jgi:TP901 family phage tail tape measure protein